MKRLISILSVLLLASALSAGQTAESDTLPEWAKEGARCTIDHQGDKITGVISNIHKYEYAEGYGCQFVADCGCFAKGCNVSELTPAHEPKSTAADWCKVGARVQVYDQPGTAYTIAEIIQETTGSGLPFVRLDRAWGKYNDGQPRDRINAADLDPLAA